MKRFLALAIIIFLSGCSSTQEAETKEYEWIAPSGKVASERSLKIIKNTCHYDAKRAESKQLVTRAVKAYQDDPDNNAAAVSKMIDQAKNIIRENTLCMRKYGLTQREKAV
ncbi:hypothetical protein L4C36_22290 [Photobacterium japonica]|uniref:hypothetical protein n=1 Tax=Photobacterium japonica TaxID=2910235 RepID=UPI003D0A4FE7